EWLRGSGVTLDAKGFVLTGPDAGPDLRALETAAPGVLAIGDVRSGSIKRVAAAVGEGAQAVAALHRYFAEVAAPSALRLTAYSQRWLVGRLATRSQSFRDASDKPLGDGPFREARPFLVAIARDEVHCILVAAHDAAFPRDVVAEDPVGALGRELGLSIGEKVCRLGGETDDQRRAQRVVAADRGKDIGVLDQAEGRRLAGTVLFQLAGRLAGDAPVGDRRRHHRNVGRERGFDLLEHL